MNTTDAERLTANLIEGVERLLAMYGQSNAGFMLAVALTDGDCIAGSNMSKEGAQDLLRLYFNPPN